MAIDQTVLDVLGNGERTTAVPAAGQVAHVAGVLNQLRFGDALADDEMFVITFETDTTQPHAV